MTIVDACRWINFNLPPKPKKVSQKIEDLDEDKLWNALLTKCEGYNQQFQFKQDTSSSFLTLERIHPGCCCICKRDHKSSESFIFFKGKKLLCWVVTEQIGNISILLV